MIRTPIYKVTKEDFCLLQGDCLKLLPQIPDNYVDMVLCDPPYGTTACKWDSVIPLESMWKELKRVIKLNSVIVMAAGQPFTSKLISSNYKMFKYCLVWEKNKSTGYLNANRMFLRAHEDIVVFYNKLGIYNPIMENGTPYNNIHKPGDSGECYGKVKTSYKTNISSRYPRSVIKCDVVRQSKHPTQKPVPLMEYLIKTYTFSGQVVLDFAMGSGTTGVACKNTNRKFIGIELDNKYFDIAKKRIYEAFCNDIKRVAIV
jgi:DNA modification methylase